MTKFMKSISAAAMIAAFTAGGHAMADEAPALKITDFAGTIEIVTGDYDEITYDTSDSRIEFGTSNSYTLNIDTDREDGDRFRSAHTRPITASTDYDDGDFSQCRTRNDEVRLKFKRGGDWVDLEDLPTLTVRGPENMHLIIEDSMVFGSVDNIGSADLELNGCGDLDFGNISGDFNMSNNGSGDLMVGDVGNADIDINGSGDFTLGDMGRANIDINGSGDGKLGHVSGPFALNINGSGDVEVGDVDGDIEANVSGSGDLSFNDTRGRVELRIGGSGDTYIRSVSGPVDLSIGGSGDIDISRGTATPFKVSSGGSGDVNFGGTAVGVDVRVNGSGDVEISDAEGNIEKSGHGDLEIGGREWRSNR